MSYTNKRVLLATKHRKEEAIQTVFESLLGCYIDVPNNYDTDKFGTFSGEVKRKKTAYETCVLKARKAAKTFGYKYAIASEGSFGPHPQLFFIPSDTEILVFLDLERNIVIAECVISEKTNYGNIDLTINGSYDSFLNKVDFPHHGLIVRELSRNNIIEKGICENTLLSEAMTQGFKKSDTIRLETDMRAMMNPQRMMVIKEVAHKLAARIKNICPSCQTPGFGKLSTEGKLPCKWCGNPTKLHEKILLSCVKCNYKTYHGREDGVTQAEPTYCDYCNP